MQLHLAYSEIQQVALIETGDELSRITEEMKELEKKLSSTAATKKQLKKERDEVLLSMIL